MSDISLKIKELESAQGLVRVIHYGCESWYAVKDRPVAISCIAIVDMATGEEVAFSLTDYEDNAEQGLLKSYYTYLRSEPDARYLHWNMHSDDYGFSAIDKRYRFLFGENPPYSVPKEMRYDLDALIEFRHGEGYVDHPKLSTLGILNRHPKRYILTGKDEAEKFQAREYGDIKRSITEKARLIAFLAKRFLAGTLETKYSGPRVSFALEKVDGVQIVLEIGNRFKAVSRQLRIRHGDRPTILMNDEFDVQDLFHSLLRLFFDDVRAEEWVPSYASGNTRTDFLLPVQGIAIELKRSRQSLSAKDLGDQLIVDTENYKKHPDIRIIICLVMDYDGYINNPAVIEKDLSYLRDGYSVTTRILG